MTRRGRGRVTGFLTRATSDDVVSVPFFAITVAFSLLNHFASSGATAYGSLLLRALAVLTASSVMIVVITGWWRGVVRRCRGGLRISMGLMGFVLGAMLRAVVLQVLLVSWGLSDLTPETLFIRFINGTLTLTIVMIVTAYVLTGAQEYRRRIGALEQDRDLLAQALEESSRIVADQQADAIDRVQRLLTTQLHSLPVDSADRALGSMESLVGDVVRPMSHDLARSVPTYQPTTLDDDDTRIRWARVWSGISLEGAIRPWLTTLVVVILGLPGALRLYGPSRGAAVIAAAGIIAPLSLMTVRRLATVPIQRASAGARPIVLAIALIVASIPVGLAIAIVAGPGPHQFFYTPSAMVTIPVVGLLLAVSHAIREQMSGVDQRLSEVSTELRWAVARSHMVQWRQQRELSSALHGPVQSALHAAMMRLRSAVESGRATPEFIAQVRDQVRLALVELLAIDGRRIDVKDELLALAETWDGIATIDVHMDDATQRCLDLDPVCAGIVGDVSQEAVSNAVRHGRAQHVRLDVSLPSPSLVALSVQADGEAPTTSTGTGLGTAMLVDCSVTWHRDVQETGSRLEAVLPLAPANDPVLAAD